MHTQTILYFDTNTNYETQIKSIESSFKTIIPCYNLKLTLYYVLVFVDSIVQRDVLVDIVNTFVVVPDDDCQLS